GTAPTPYCPLVPGPLPPVPQPAPPPSDQGPSPEPEPAPTQAPAAGFEGARGGAGLGESFALAAPNMIGDLLGASRSVAYYINRAQGNAFVNAFGATSILNTAI